MDVLWTFGSMKFVCIMIILLNMKHGRGVFVRTLLNAITF